MTEPRQPLTAVDPSQRATEAQAGLHAARIATATMFFINGALFANWVVRIPAVQQDLGIGAGVLGLALLGMPLGSLPTMPVAGWLVTRYGSRLITLLGTLIMCVALPLPAIAPNAILLTLALVVLGTGAGAMDVAMNAHGVVVEQRYRRPIMSSLHALFSIGGLAGSVFGGLIAAAGIAPLPHLLGAAVALGLVSIFAARYLLPAGTEVVGHTPLFVRPNRALVGLAVIAFCVVLGEGAMADWSAIYLRRSIGTGAGFAAAGYAVFSLMMAAGRLTGDHLAQTLGPRKLVEAGGLVAAVGMIVAVGIHQPIAVLVGFGAVGAGFSFIFPIVLSAAARTPGMPPSLAIAALTTTGYFGFMAGPPMIGLAAEVSSLRAALAIVAMLSLIIALLGTTINRENRHS